jgi:hypothetical protein
MQRAGSFHGMKSRKVQRTVRSLLPVLLVYGCSALQTSQYRITADVGEVGIDRSRYAYFERVTVRSIGGATEVNGLIRSRNPYSRVFPGHINISVIAADGEQLDVFEVAYRLRRTPRRIRRTATFGVVVPYSIEPGTRIRLAYHYGFLKGAHPE